MRNLFFAAMFCCACSHGPAPECDAIAERCHEISMGANATATQKDCHESAEGKWSASECTSNHDRCFTACTLPDGGAP